MKLFFDPIKAQPDVKPLDYCVAVDMQLEELLNAFLASKEQEEATLEILNQFCSNREIISYRADIIGDMIKNDGLFSLFCNLRADLWDLNLLYELKMFKNVPELSTMITFLIIEKFTEVYKKFMDGAEALDKSVLSEPVKAILAEACSDGKKQELEAILKDMAGLRDSLETIGEIRLNRYFSRGQNIENSIIPKTEDKSLMMNLAGITGRLGLDVSEAYAPAVHQPREFTRPVFKSLYTLYYDIFKNIDTFHEKYKDVFDTAWLDLIKKLDAVIGFARIFREIIEKGFACAKAVPAESTDILDFYSLFLVKRGLAPEQVVYNDYVYEKSSFFFITGPNAGGKTIYLSAVGLCQLFFQACGHVPAKKAKIKIMKRMFTHFPVEEYNDNSGRLVEEQGRVERILRDVTDGQSLALFNETYSSTKADIAYKLSTELVDKVLEHDISGLFVTHLHSLKDYAAETTDRPHCAGVLTALNDEKTGKRLYKIVPLSTQNSSFARDILLKYDMTVEQMLERIQKKREEN
ncbi:MAG: hypothetical protein J5816_00875 [Clostridia bacterium]|nr:hypothetical protein [Clostridia bacterium]